MTRLLLRIVVALGAAIVVVASTLILFQDRLINPAILSARSTGEARVAGELPEGVSSYFFQSGDALLEMWSLMAFPPQTEAPRVALIFHGNGETVENNLYLLQLLSRQGFDAYVFDYRGYGRSSGVPDEHSMYQDAERFFEVVRARYTSSPRYLFWGGSLGTGFASYMATRHEPLMLVLVAPFSSIPDVVGAHPWYGPLSPFLWWELPTARYVGTLSSSCLVVAHGGVDTVISPDNSDRVVAAYRGQGEVTYLRYPDGDHFTIVELAHHEIIEAIQRCRLLR